MQHIRLKRVIIPIIVILVNIFYINAAEHYVDPAFYDVIQKLIDDGLDSTHVTDLFNDKRVKFIDKLVLPNIVPQETKSTYSGFLSNSQVKDGYRFLLKYRDSMEEAIDGSEIPVEIVVAVLKVETNFGRRSGDYPIIASLATISSLSDPAHYRTILDSASVADKKKIKQRGKRRSKWAYQELKTFLKVCEMKGWNPLEINGSWAGAFGWAQFLPSSYLAYAKDGDGDSKIDPFNLQDAAASIVNYLQKAGWRKNQRRAIIKYNPSSAYADCILQYAEKLKQMSFK